MWGLWYRSGSRWSGIGADQLRRGFCARESHGALWQAFVMTGVLGVGLGITFAGFCILAAALAWFLGHPGSTA